MKLFLTIVCSIATMATADVAHLERNYLPPSRTVAFNSAQGYTAGNNFNERVTQVQVLPSANFALPPVALPSYSSGSSFSTGYSAPARLTAPSAPTGFFAQRFNSARLAAPSRQYLSPEVETFEPIVQRTAPARFTAPSAGFLLQRFDSARLTAPSRQYLSPEVETFEPIVQKTSAIQYSAPATTGAASARLASSNFDTKYSADGGYVY